MTYKWIPFLLLFAGQVLMVSAFYLHVSLPFAMFMAGLFLCVDAFILSINSDDTKPRRPQ